MTAPKRPRTQKTTKATKPKKATAKTKTPSLRERAERMLSKQKERLDELSTTDLKKLVHELGTHQIELEMQNEELHRMQVELEASRNSYADLYDFAPTGYCTVDLGGLIQEINLTAVKLLGIERRSLINRPFSTHVEKESRDAYRLHRTAVLESREKQVVEVRLKGRGTAGFYALVESIAVEDAAGKAVAIRSAVSDISGRKQAEEALKKANETLELHVAERTASLHESEERLRYHVDNSPLAVVEWDADFNVTRWAGEAEKIFGWSAAETVGKPVMALLMIFDEDLPLVQKTMEKLTDGKSRQVVSTNRNYTKDGRVIHCIWYNTVLLDAAGRMKSIMSQVLDITDRKRAEDALRESEQRLMLAHKAAKIGAFEWNVQTGENVWTPELEAMYGLTRGEFGKTQPAWEQLLHPEDRAAALDLVSGAFESGEPVEGEWRVVWRDGSEHWITGRFQAFKDASGKPLRLSGVNMDITERKRAEERLQKQARMLDSVGQAVIATDINQNIIYWNQTAASMFGWSSEEVLGRTLMDMLSPQAGPAALHEIMATLARGETWSGEIIVQSRDNRMIPLLTSNSPLVDAHGRMIAVIGIGTDITERKRAEEALRQSEEKYRTLFTSVSEGFTLNQVLYDEKGKLYDLRVLEANPAAERANGLTRDKFVGMTWRELWPGAEDYWWDICNKVMLNNEEARFENYARVHDRWYEVHHFKAGTDLMGSIFTDVTGRKKADEALRESESRFRALFESMAEGFSLNEIILDEAGTPVDLRYLSVNPAFERHTGLKAGDIIGRTTRELFPDAEAVWFERYGKVVLTGEPAHFEERFGPLNKWFEVSVYRTEPRRLASVFFDITERKQAEVTVRQHLEEMKNLNKDLERFNRVAVDRELRMIALKKELNELSVKAGMQPRYALDFEHKD